MVAKRIKLAFNQRLILIAGGSRGIGLSLARQLADLGASLWLVARREELLRAALAELESHRVNPQQRFGYTVIDLADWEKTRQGFHTITAQVGLPDILINSAGVVEPAFSWDQTIDQYRWMMAINYFGTVHAVKALLPDFLARRAGHIVNFSSLAGYIAPFGYTAYAASKFAVRGFSDALRAEFHRTPLKVSLVVPADTRTPSLDEENQLRTPEMRAFSESNARPVSAELTACQVIQGMAKGKYLIFTGPSRFLYLINNLAGSLAYPLGDIFMDQAYREVRRHPDRYPKPKAS